MNDDNIKCSEIGIIDIWRFYEEGVKEKSEANDHLKEIKEHESTDQPTSILVSALKPFMTVPLDDRNIMLPGLLPARFYRGQSNSGYGLTPSIDREKVCDDPVCDRLVKEMRIQDFGIMLSRTRRCKEWSSIQLGSPDSDYVPAKGLDIDYRSLAQHFWIPTERLDLTNDRSVALFFACTQYEGNGVYRPLNEDDLVKCNTGAVFSFDLIDLSHRNDFEYVFPIPVQPYIRPQLQSGFTFINKKDRDVRPVKWTFKHDLEFSEFICRKFDNGRTLFHEDGTEWIASEVDAIRASHHFSEAAFVRACRYLNIPHDEKRRMKALLRDAGYEIGKPAYGISLTEIEAKEPDWSVMRYLSSIGADTSLPILTTAYGDDDQRIQYTKDRPISPILTYILGLYVMVFKRTNRSVCFER